MDWLVPRPSKQPKPAAGPHAAPPVADAAGVVQVKVWLLGISTMVWRRLLVPDTCTLREPTPRSQKPSNP